MSLNFLKIFSTADAEIIGLLNRNIIGTPGQSMLYQHMGVENKIHQIEKPYFTCLVRHNRILGVICFCCRTTVNAGRNTHAYYARYFSFREIFRRKSFRGRPLLRQSNLRVEINLVLGGYGLDIPANGKFFHYAYVDPRNVRSRALCNEFGFEKVREYATIIFTRINPKQGDLVVTAATREEEPHMKELVGTFYKDYTMFSYENLFRGRKYYVLRDGSGKILAGAQVHPDEWRIHSLPGVLGKLMLNIFSWLPFVGKIFGRKFQFITLDGLYYASGHEKTLEPFIENLLARYGAHSAIVVVDADTRVYRDLKTLDLGLIDKLSEEVRGNVICRFSTFGSEEKSSFRSKPAYISGIDVT